MEAVAAGAAIGSFLVLRLVCFLAPVVLCHRASKLGESFEAEVKWLSLSLKLKTGPSDR